ncbi:hypothetical protein PR202_ga15618 [Eleusine coracana subsp. coracana]|uniref:DUF6598 domain-containing protein n=1 Tax=Eleusine coracana subsp. coracana TaxID=191504 RepID=A0AAV5CKM0_ELECO|nr:hypothetical protein QOZ80_6BG0491030 [Eleusine coracana subsp. coracana]GJM98593.1 hypothetical protein PR202_ga15618 [Eleusine coracana subsp. coracana]
MLTAASELPRRCRDGLDRARGDIGRKGLLLWQQGGRGGGGLVRQEIHGVGAMRNLSLELTGPTRAVAMLCPVTFEVELTVKGSCESEDKDLSYLAVPLIRPALGDSTLHIRDYTSKLSTLEFTFGHIFYSVEATISVQVIGGSWLGYRSEFFAYTSSFNEKVVLLDSEDEEVPVTDDGKIELSREVASVEHKGKLRVFVKAWHGDNFLLMKDKVFRAKEAGRSHGKFDVGFCKMQITVAWSLITVDYNPKEKVL